ncbi:MAG TPA: hypothetical protein VHK88_01600 [Aquihabitans sp.]|nr:hypothetical protein [Aquihabitans sp.]
MAFDNVQQILSDDEQRSAYQAATSHLLQLRQGDAWMSASSEIRRDVLNQFLELNERLGDEAERDLAALVDAALELADLELDTLHAERAIELARTALRSVDPGDRLTDARARRVLANALVAAGRAPEAIPLLERAATESSDDADVADLREAVELAESGPVIASDVGELRLSEWEPWEPKPVASLTSLSASEIGGLIAEVVACEGPVLFGRVAFLLREASGASRAGAAIRNALDRGLAAAVASGTVVASAPDASGESRRRTLRAPGQVVTVRTLGPRDAWDVPPDEMEALARTIVAVERPPDREALKRRVASLYGWKRYTAPLDELLESNLPGDIAVSAARVSTPPSAGAPDTSGVAAEISTAGSAGEVRLEAWEPWQEHPVESLTSLDASHLGELIAEIVDAEGPVLVRRVTYLLRVASGASRAGGAMRDAIERGLAAAVEGGRLVVSDPDALGDADRRTLSVPGQPTRIRVLPPRDTWDVPAAELALLARTIVSDGAHVDREAVKRRIGDLYGWSRYTGPLDELLEALLPEDI